MSRLIYLFVIVFAVVRCAGDEVSISAEITPTTSPTSQPSATPISPTSTSTQPPQPTKTPRPTWTVIPTNTPLPPTAVPTQLVATETHTPTLESEPQPTVTDAPTSAELPTSTVAPIQVVATATPLPTETLLPAETAVPTATPLPTATAVPTSPPTAVPPPTISGLADLPDGTEVTVAGNVVNTSSFSHGFKFTLADDTGRITLLLWHNVYDDCWDCGGLNIGASVVTTGEIGRFDGELQVAPTWGGGVQVTSPAYAWAQPQTVNNLANLKGQRVMVEGSITDTFSNEQFTKLQVNDGTGTVEIFMWKNLWDRVATRHQLTTGAHVKAVGVVGEFNGTIQVQPMLPVDVLP